MGKRNHGRHRSNDPGTAGALHRAEHEHDAQQAQENRREAGEKKGEARDGEAREVAGRKAGLYGQGQPRC